MLVMLVVGPEADDHDFSKLGAGSSINTQRCMTCLPRSMERTILIGLCFIDWPDSPFQSHGRHKLSLSGQRQIRQWFRKLGMRSWRRGQYLQVNEWQNWTHSRASFSNSNQRKLRMNGPRLQRRSMKKQWMNTVRKWSHWSPRIQQKCKGVYACEFTMCF